MAAPTTAFGPGRRGFLLPFLGRTPTLITVCPACPGSLVQPGQ
jgi:hypothetical protein